MASFSEIRETPSRCWIISVNEIFTIYRFVLNPLFRAYDFFTTFHPSKNNESRYLSASWNCCQFNLESMSRSILENIYNNDDAVFGLIPLLQLQMFFKV